MEIQRLHRWDLTPKEAVQLQRDLADQIDVRTPLREFTTVAGADISYRKFDPTLYASVVVVRVADGSIVGTSDVVRQASFPYVPGLLSFRESPALLDAFAELKTRPDVVMIDGQGYAHPRRMGIACHIGLWLGIPTLGCAKSRLVGTHREPAPRRGSVARLMDRKEQIGYVVRTKNGTSPLYVSAGYMIDLASAVRVVLATTHGYRIPEPTRLAHLRVNALRRASTGSAAVDSL
jgi:deoxyribonuclease V